MKSKILVISIGMLVALNSLFAEPPGPSDQPSDKAPLHLQTELKDGPPAETIQAALKKMVTDDPSWAVDLVTSQGYLSNMYGPTGLVYNILKAGKITNEYSRRINDETVFVYDIAADVVVKMPGQEIRSKKKSTLIAIVRRGSKWYITSVPN